MPFCPTKPHKRRFWVNVAILAIVTCLPSSVITGKGDIAATFRPSQQATDPHSHTPHVDSPTQPGSLQEDLFVMTASGGLVRHQLKLQAKAQSEAGPAAADRYSTHTCCFLSLACHLSYTLFSHILLLVATALTDRCSKCRWLSSFVAYYI